MFGITLLPVNHCVSDITVLFFIKIVLCVCMNAAIFVWLMIADGELPTSQLQLILSGKGDSFFRAPSALTGSCNIWKVITHC